MILGTNLIITLIYSLVLGERVCVCVTVCFYNELDFVGVRSNLISMEN